MTDVYIAYAREDRESVRVLSEMLRFEGWDVWMDPEAPSMDNSAAVDLKLGSAGAILVVWSGYSRGSEYVRSEAATGLYKNKLIQVRVDAAAPPRPFDQIEVVDIGLWSGERDDPHWRKILAAVRLYAGAPGSARPQVTRRALSGPAYLEPQRSVAWAPLIAAGVLVAAGAGVWLGDPFGWRSGAPAEVDGGASIAALEDEATLAAASGSFEDTEASNDSWTRVDRNSADGLRDYVVEYPRASNAETARSLLRVLDAQAWVHAVTLDNEAGYQAYLKGFPVDGAMPGAMAGSARERLVSLSSERTQAIEEIQRGLVALRLYKGEIDGKGGDGTARAMRQFASDRKRSYPTLSTAAPRDLRAFADAINVVAGKSGSPQVAQATPKAPIIATATTSSNTAAAAAADRQRIAQAQAAAQAAAQTAAAEPGADSLALAERQRVTDVNAWLDADRTGTVASYQAYLSANPSGAQVAAARAAIVRLSNKPAPFSLDLVSGDVKAIAENARRAQASANARAAAAREAAAAASSAPGVRNIVAADGDQYEAQISGGAPNGLGVRISGNSTNAGDRYRGELRNGQSAGVGVYEFADNPSNAAANALRYEGEHSNDAAAGYGVTYWKNGDSFAGQDASSGQARGVLTFSNGQRYEGELRNGVRNGMGVVWSADGNVVMAGRWANGELVEPMKAPATGGGGE